MPGEVSIWPNILSDLHFSCPQTLSNQACVYAGGMSVIGLNRAGEREVHNHIKATCSLWRVQSVGIRR